MSAHIIDCDSCGTEIGAVGLPDDASPADVARATSGNLCRRCGSAYVGLVNDGDLDAGATPTQAQVDGYQPPSA